MPAYMHGNLATQQPQRPEKKVRIKETKKVVVRSKTLPVQEKLLYLFTVVVCVMVAGLIIWRYAQIYEMNQKILAMEQSIKEIEAQNVILKQQVDKLSDPLELEKQAKLLGLSFQDPQTPGTTDKSKKTETASAQTVKKTKDQP
ncbi:septum formation initiator family protein [Paenibacillus mucilaginosus]|uniref:Cell division protein FtsL n=1 Tax=Paenibacillus mucilaginosus (strain KNP414) TaxID=1036673 RepID=F8FDP0_PAEMK|nr:septum formation initiator family protein [Paenibacillus mucilaginosus]AEI42605.1 cell division protein FtsL [Paenibacillus mucilaginosus KNP414]MCG7213995.1 septum formation initiator family protein [Paenibacillus mucilaginosus]WDM25996.1 septum formation initiator family protein [Paenibacillus mucilaginosus]